MVVVFLLFVCSFLYLLFYGVFKDFCTLVHSYNVCAMFSVQLSLYHFSLLVLGFLSPDEPKHDYAIIIIITIVLLLL